MLVLNADLGVSMVQDGSIHEADINADVARLGVNQTWQDVTASRAIGVTYTNTTGKPIIVSFSGLGSTDTNRTRLMIGGVTFYSDMVGVAQGSVSGVVPNNVTYLAIAPNGAMQNWLELR